MGKTLAAERLIVLGDFLHGATADGDSFLQAFSLWRRAHAQLEIEVIAGNHDRREARDKWAGLLKWGRRLGRSRRLFGTTLSYPIRKAM